MRVVLAAVLSSLLLTVSAALQIFSMFNSNPYFQYGMYCNREDESQTILDITGIGAGTRGLVHFKL
jgi:hypothetical protein